MYTQVIKKYYQPHTWRMRMSEDTVPYAYVFPRLESIY